MIKYFQRREYFIRSYYKSVILQAIDEEQMREIDRLIISHKLEFDIYSKIEDIKPIKLVYELDFNGFCIQDSNMVRFRRFFGNFMRSFIEKNLDNSFNILDYEIFSINNMINSIKFSILSHENVDISKGWFDYNLYYRINKTLKNYNNKYKKKNVISNKKPIV